MRAFLSLREKEFVEAAKASGAGDAHHHQTHAAERVGPIIVSATLIVAAAILTEAALSFLGFGIQPPHPALGKLIDEGQNEGLNRGGSSRSRVNDRVHRAVHQLHRRRAPRRARPDRGGCGLSVRWPPGSPALDPRPDRGVRDGGRRRARRHRGGVRRLSRRDGRASRLGQERQRDEPARPDPTAARAGRGRKRRSRGAT